MSIINDLHQIMNSLNDNIIIKRLVDVINKMNNIINENRKNVESIKNDIKILLNKFDELKSNN